MAGGGTAEGGSEVGVVGGGTVVEVEGEGGGELEDLLPPAERRWIRN